MTPSALTGEAAIVETRRDLRLLPAVANALAHLPPTWRTHRVVAFEPFASNLALQNATRCAHPYLAQHITLHPFGLSNATRRCDLYANRRGSYDNKFD